MRKENARRETKIMQGQGIDSLDENDDQQDQDEDDYQVSNEGKSRSRRRLVRGAEKNQNLGKRSH